MMALEFIFACNPAHIHLLYCIFLSGPDLYLYYSELLIYEHAPDNRP